MKTSNKLLVGFLVLVVGIILFAAFQLKAEYQKINTRDKYRNYERIPLQSVRFLEIKGNLANKPVENVNDFFINCISSNENVLLLPKDDYFRKFINYVYSGDTLIISSKLPYSYEETIFLLGAKLEQIKANSATITVDNLNIKHLQLSLERNAQVVVTKTRIESIDATLNDKSKLSFIENASVNNLTLKLQKQAEIDLGGVKLDKISLQMSPLARISATKDNLVLLQKTGSLQ